MKSAKYMDLFIEESLEHLQSFNDILLSLEKEGYVKSEIQEAYRIIHTIKGSSNIMGFVEIGSLAHKMEDLLDVYRSKEASPSNESINIIFKTTDMLEDMIKQLMDTGLIKIDPTSMINELNSLLDVERGLVKGKEDYEADAGHQETEGPTIEFGNEQMGKLKVAASKDTNLYQLSITLNAEQKFKEGRVFQIIREISKSCDVIATSTEGQEIDDTLGTMSVIVATELQDDALPPLLSGVPGIDHVCVSDFDIEDIINFGQIDDDMEGTGPDTQSKTGKNALSISDTVRVKSRLLDKLLDLVGEIMIGSIRVNQVANDMKNRELKLVLKSNDRLMGELQDVVLNMRMVPVNHIFKRFPRMVRDMAQASDKEINFHTVGNDIEIDRSLLDSIGDSLVHILRNAIDHGIEPREVREMADKTVAGSLLLSAFREGSNIIITVEDDGKGMDVDSIKRKALETGCILKDELDKLDESECLSLAFHPGLSTAAEVTEVSGRGVGLDVVKSKIEGMGGSVRLKTVPGEGTKVTMRLPPSMSIIRAMLVRINGEKYAIPLENVRQTVKVPQSEIHEIAKKGIFRLRDEVLPVLNLKADFGGAIEAAKTADDIPGLIVEKDDVRACLLVSDIIGQQEIVVKNVGRDIWRAECFSGATILGDGRVAMIMDVGALL